MKMLSQGNGDDEWIVSVVFVVFGIVFVFLWYIFVLIYSRDHCQRFSPSQISDTPWPGFEPAQKLSSGFIE